MLFNCKTYLRNSASIEQRNLLAWVGVNGEAKKSVPLCSYTYSEVGHAVNVGLLLEDDSTSLKLWKSAIFWHVKFHITVFFANRHGASTCVLVSAYHTFAVGMEYLFRVLSGYAGTQNSTVMHI